MNKYIITNNIRKLRFLNNEMSQEELAKKASVARQTINAIENNKYSPSLELAFKIAIALNAQINEVFDYLKSN